MLCDTKSCFSAQFLVAMPFHFCCFCVVVALIDKYPQSLCANSEATVHHTDIIKVQTCVVVLF